MTQNRFPWFDYFILMFDNHNKRKLFHLKYVIKSLQSKCQTWVSSVVYASKAESVENSINVKQCVLECLNFSNLLIFEKLRSQVVSTKEAQDENQTCNYQDNSFRKFVKSDFSRRIIAKCSLLRDDDYIAKLSLNNLKIELITIFKSALKAEFCDSAKNIFELLDSFFALHVLDKLRICKRMLSNNIKELSVVLLSSLTVDDFEILPKNKQLICYKENCELLEIAVTKNNLFAVQACIKLGFSFEREFERSFQLSLLLIKSQNMASLHLMFRFGFHLNYRSIFSNSTIFEDLRMLFLEQEDINSLKFLLKIYHDVNSNKLLP